MKGSSKYWGKGLIKKAIKERRNKGRKTPNASMGLLIATLKSLADV
jgi:hypothetical protein